MSEYNSQNKYAKDNQMAREMASHGMTKGELQALHEAQKRGQEVEQMQGNVDPDYLFPKHERNHLHLEQITPNYDQFSGKDNSLYSVTKWNPEQFEAAEKRGLFSGYKVRILHDPRKVEESQYRNEDGKFIPKSEPVKILKDG